MDSKVTLSSSLHSRPGQGTGRCCLRTATKGVFEGLCNSEARCDYSNCWGRGDLVFLTRHCICIGGRADDFDFPKLWLLVAQHHEATFPILSDSDYIFKVHYQDHEIARLWNLAVTTLPWSPVALMCISGRERIVGGLGEIKRWRVAWGKIKARVQTEVERREGDREGCRMN